MLQLYNTLRQKYIVDGYEEAYAYIEEIEEEMRGCLLPDEQSECETQSSPQNERNEILLTNLYCYIAIQSEYKRAEMLLILEECLSQISCMGNDPSDGRKSCVQAKSLKLLTQYHICSVLFKSSEYEECSRKCQ